MPPSDFAAAAARATKHLAGGQRVLSADCECRERQRQMKTTSEAFPEAAREESFRGVEPEADGTL